MKAWLGLGSNLQQPLKQLGKALKRLDDEAGLKVLEVSSFYKTPPWGDEDQDEFVNAVVQVETAQEPTELLHLVQSIENDMGRQRDKRRWGPRVIDIDLLLFEGRQLKTSELELPHPRMHERAFVLAPLAELDAMLEIPGHGRVVDLLGKCDSSGISRLDVEAVD
jgi:2-amino-4-hydroxy-6-hydroxymethyldihydropteridine diphosphokinase